MTCTEIHICHVCWWRRRNSGPNTQKLRDRILLETETLDSQGQVCKIVTCHLLFLSYVDKFLSDIFVGTKWCCDFQYNVGWLITVINMSSIFNFLVTKIFELIHLVTLKCTILIYYLYSPQHKIEFKKRQKQKLDLFLPTHWSFVPFNYHW